MHDKRVMVLVFCVLMAAAVLLGACSGQQGTRQEELPGGFEATTTPGDTSPSVDVTSSTEGTGTQLQLSIGQQRAERFRQLAEDSGLFAAVDRLGPYTVLAPTDDALAKLGDARIEELGRPENRDELVQLVGYHIVPGRWTESDIRQATVLPTLSGRFIRVNSQGDELILGEGSRLVEQSRESSAGIVYTIDTVLEPRSGFDGPNAGLTGPQVPKVPSNGSTMTTP